MVTQNSLHFLRHFWLVEFNGRKILTFTKKNTLVAKAIQSSAILSSPMVELSISQTQRTL